MLFLQVLNQALDSGGHGPSILGLQNHFLEGNQSFLLQGAIALAIDQSHFCSEFLEDLNWQGVPRWSCEWIHPINQGGKLPALMD